MTLFTEQELQNLSAEIDLQLQALQHSAINVAETKRIGDTKKTIPEPQRQQLQTVISETTKITIKIKTSTTSEAITEHDTPESFMKKFARVAKQELCLEGGVLHEQWKKYGDLDNETMINHFGSVLAGWGLASAPLQTAVVVVSVLVLHIGIKAFCEDCE
jgi:hypothetical protein